MSYKLNTMFGDYEVEMEKTAYSNNGRLAIQLYSEDGPFATLSVNLPDEPIDDKENEFFLDANNCPWGARFLAQYGLAIPTGRYAFSGFCMYPLYKLMNPEEKPLRDIIKGDGRKYYLVDTNIMDFDGAWETAVFRCKKNGAVSNWDSLLMERTDDYTEAKQNHQNAIDQFRGKESE